jgi:aldose 1-epimerase
VYDSCHANTERFFRCILFMSLRNPLLFVGQILACCALLLTGCSAETTHFMKKESFGATPQGKSVDLFTFSNAHGLEVRAITYGGIIVSLRVPDKAGHVGDIFLGLNDLPAYSDNKAYLGAIIGRYGNRIAGAQFKLDGKTYKLAANNGPNTLHGGNVGFNKVVWEAKPFENENGVGVIFTHTSPDGDEGFPGNLKVKVTYTLTAQDELIFDYEATTDKATPVNLTQHTYFNLAGAGNGDILGHHMMLNADRFTPVNKDLIPLGELRPVKNTPFDFTKPTAIGERINQNDEQLVLGKGYDHNFVLNRTGSGTELAARVHEPQTGRIMEVYTTEPGVQFYTGNFLDGIAGKNGQFYKQRFGFCLETQHFPDSPNQPAFPSTILKPGDTYHSRTIYKFSVDK